ncbi:MAG: DUF58 domain-containing protein [Bacteroidia bacterium]
MSQQLSLEQLAAFDNLEFLARQVVEGFITGLHKSPYHGFSVEFSEHRLYNTGESTRNIDWKLYARTEKLFVKRFEEETNLRCQLVIDASGSMFFPEGRPNKLHFSVYAAAVLLNLFKRQRDAVGLSVFDSQMRISLKARSNPTHHKVLLGELERLLQSERASSSSTRAVAALHEIAETAHPRSLIVIFSDMFEPGTHTEALFAALQHLRYNKHEVLLFHVLDKAHELELNYANRPHVFVDMESGEELRLNPTAVQKVYREKAGAFKQELLLRCGQYKIEYIEADISKGFEQVLMPYLLKRGKLY